MKMKKFFAVMLLMVMALSTSNLKAQSLGPIPVDEEVRIGKLDCGLTYYIRHNDYPEHRVNFYIAQRVGSIQEEESQRGLAHFLEHMAFNGSEHFTTPIIAGIVLGCILLIIAFILNVMRWRRARAKEKE